MDPWEAELAEDAQAVLGAGYRFRARDQGNTWVVDIVRDDGFVAWPDFGGGLDPLRAILAAEQRYLVEQAGKGAVRGQTYLDKANERIRRFRETRA